MIDSCESRNLCQRAIQASLDSRWRGNDIKGLHELRQLSTGATCIDRPESKRLPNVRLYKGCHDALKPALPLEIFQDRYGGGSSVSNSSANLPS